MKISVSMRVSFVLCLCCVSGIGYSQQQETNMVKVRTIVDSLGRKGIITYSEQEKPTIKFTQEQALKYLQEKFRPGDWYDNEDPLRKAIGELIYIATHQRYDSLARYLASYQYDSIGMPWVKFFKWDSLKMKIPVIIPIVFVQPHDSVQRWDTIGAVSGIDTTLSKNRRTDSLKAYRSVRPASTVIMKDTVFLVAERTIPEVSRFSNRQPFRVYRYPFQSDSISLAIKILTGWIAGGDSSKISIRGLSGAAIPVWLNSRSERMERYWLRNEFNDSVIVWIGAAGRDTLGMFPEEGVMFKRPVKQTNISNAQLNLRQINSGQLQKIGKAYIKPKYWKVRTENNFILNQTYLTNWASGGQSSVSLTLDAFGYADYKNDKLKLLSDNYIRIKYGQIKPGQEKIRMSADQLEFNSKINHKAFGKFDFSAIILFKTQIFKNYDYPNDLVPVSAFMNPGYLTIGFGLDFKPEKKTSINFAPLTYRATFMIDTVKYSRTKYGIPKNRHALQEPGVSLLVTNEFSPFKTLTLTNRLQLFTSYISRPTPNYVIDWELIATAKLNWFTDVRLNTHLVYDDKVLIPLVDSKGKPVLGGDGIQRKGKRTQFKELVGFSFVFRF